jgi:hypothetical protein
LDTGRTHEAPIIVLNLSGYGGFSNEDKLLTDYIAFNSFGVKEAGGTQKETSRGKIKLGGQEYLKAETVISIGDMHVCYYARKIDDDVILFMSISFPKNRTAEEFEKCFE